LDFVSILPGMQLMIVSDGGCYNPSIVMRVKQCVKCKDGTEELYVVWKPLTFNWRHYHWITAQLQGSVMHTTQWNT